MKITESLHSASGESVSCLASVFTTQDGLLHIFDPNQKSSIVLCNKSNCEHEPYDENTNPDPTCDAALNKDLFSIVFLLYPENMFICLDRRICQRELFIGKN